MTEIHTVEPFPSPRHKLGFLLDWLLTLKCNYDCSYCSTEGHDNSQAHPAQEVCEKMLEQGFSYVDSYMEIRKPNMRSVSLNVYGGEAVYRKDVEYLLEKSSKLYTTYKDKWSLTRMLTTNASCDIQKWKNITDHVEYVTFSYHAQGPAKSQENFMRNIEYTHKQNKSYAAIVLMYPKMWEKCMYTLEYLQRKGYNVRPRILDGREGVYTKEQMEQCFEIMKEKDYSLLEKIKNKPVATEFRACCGGRSLCVNRNLKEPKRVVPRQDWVGWKCSANHFFLMMNCHDRNFYTNKDCHVRHDGTRGAIASTENMDLYIQDLKNKLKQTSNYFLTCVQKECLCGTCAPKSLTEQGLLDVMKSYNL